MLDRLAGQGRVFTNTHAHNVVTLPSHTNILTGLYPFQHGVRDDSGFRLPAGVPTIATVLHGAGYTTGAFVGAFPLDSQFGLTTASTSTTITTPGEQRHRVPDRRAAGRRRGAPGLSWWQRQPKGKPRFLVHLNPLTFSSPQPFASRCKDNLYLGEVAAADSFLAPLLVPSSTAQAPPGDLVAQQQLERRVGRLEREARAPPSP